MMATVQAGADVLIRHHHGSIAITGWGWIALLLILGSLEEIGRRR